VEGAEAGGEIVSPRRSGTRGWIRDEIARSTTHTEHAEPTCVFDAERHLYTIGDVIVPSVTQVLNELRLIDFSSVPDGILAAAQARGTYVHQVLHYYIEGDFDLDDCVPEYRGYVDSALAYLAEVQSRPFDQVDGKPVVEYRFWHAPLMFAGTVDHLAWDADDVLAITDFKTGEPSEVAAPLQTAAYELGVRHCLLPKLSPRYVKTVRRRAIKLFKDGRPGRPEPYTDVRDTAIFLAALAVVHYRRNGLKHPE
jgi:hypothetical protein